MNDPLPKFLSLVFVFLLALLLNFMTMPLLEFNFEIPFAIKNAVVNDPIYYAPPLFIIAILLELGLSAYFKTKNYEGKEAFASIGMGLGVLFIGLPFKYLAFHAFHFLNQFAPASWIEFLSHKHWYAWVLILFADDFSFYWHHRLSHEIRILWAAHVNHHSSQTLNLATALRQSWTEIIYKNTFWLWMALVGFEASFILAMQSISLMYQFLMHTELVHKLGPFEWIFNTPSHHRVHHGSNVRYLDRNHAGILIIWDRLFGTFEAERDDEKVIYGIRNNIHSYNPFYIATHEFINIYHDLKQAKSFSECLKILFYPPGWSANGKSQTTKILRQGLEKNKK